MVTSPLVSSCSYEPNKALRGPEYSLAFFASACFAYGGPAVDHFRENDIPLWLLEKQFRFRFFSLYGTKGCKETIGHLAGQFIATADDILQRVWRLSGY